MNRDRKGRFQSKSPFKRAKTKASRIYRQVSGDNRRRRRGGK